MASGRGEWTPLQRFSVLLHDVARGLDRGLSGRKGGLWEMWKFWNDFDLLDQDSRNIEVDDCQV